MGYHERLIELRKKNNYTQEELAGIIGVSRQAISKWESGMANPDIEKLIKLSELYGCSIDYIVGNDNKIDENYLKKISEMDCIFPEIDYKIYK